MNTGLQDAYNLAWKLALVVTNRADDVLLDTYEAERRPFAERLLATTDRAFRVVISESWFSGMLRTHIIPRVAAIAMKRRRVKRAAFQTLSQIGIQYRESALSEDLESMHQSSPHAGDRFPWLRLRFHAESPLEDLFQKLDDTRFNLLLIGQPESSAASLQFDDLLQVHTVPSHVDNERALAAASIPIPSYYLLRPDGHIGLAGGVFRESDLRQWLTRSHLWLEGTGSKKLTMAS